MASHDDFLPRVEQVWRESFPLYHSRAALSLFHRKLKKLKFTLRELNRTRFGNLPQQTADAYTRVCSAQNRAMNDPTQLNVTDVSVASDDWHRLKNLEKNFFKQKSRIQWLKCCDQNTVFYHRVAQSNATRNAIRRLRTTMGEILTKPEDIKAEAARHFQEFLQGKAREFHEAPPDYFPI